jgi:hypothetical protein
MIKGFDGVPDYERRVLVERYFGRWRGQITANEADEAKEYVREHFIYSLRMFWQARFAKMDSDSRSLFDWVSRNLLPKEVSYAGIRNDQFLIDHADHDQLAYQIFDSLWGHYATCSDSGLDWEEKRTFTSRLLGLFRR